LSTVRENFSALQKEQQYQDGAGVRSPRAPPLLVLLSLARGTLSDMGNQHDYLEIVSRYQTTTSILFPQLLDRTIREFSNNLIRYWTPSCLQLMLPFKSPVLDMDQIRDMLAPLTFLLGAQSTQHQKQCLIEPLWLRFSLQMIWGSPMDTSRYTMVNEKLIH
ncbi:hypothetical protein GOODEAATRI_017048, partial [Goodea atripinnis]